MVQTAIAETASTSSAVVALVACSVISLVLLLRHVLWDRKRQKSASSLPPVVPHWMPFLGNAVEYGKDGPAFMLKYKKKYGPVFVMNIVGRPVVILGDRSVIRHYAAADEKAMSAVAAVEDFGFANALGQDAVCPGTAIIASLVRSQVQPSLRDLINKLVPRMRKAFRRIVQEQITGTNNNNNNVCQLDVFSTMRKLALESIIEIFFGPELITTADGNNNSFVDQFVTFQDELEDLVGKQIAMPRWLARRLLAPLEKKRQAVLDNIVRVIQHRRSLPDSEKPSDFLQGLIDFRGPFPKSTITPDRVEEFNQRVAAEEGQPKRDLAIAEYCLGFLFAAHKSPAIGASQILLLLLEHPQYLELVIRESTSFADATTDKDYYALVQGDAMPAMERCMHETLRVISHNIGSMRKVMQPEGFRIPIPQQPQQQQQPKDGHNRPDSNNNNGTECYVIPQGYYVAVSPLLVSMNEEEYGPEDTRKYNPERFNKNTTNNNDNGNSKKNRMPQESVVFSAGVHMCPGRSFAYLLMKSLVALWLSEGTVSVGKSGIPPLCFKKATLAQRAAPCIVAFQPNK